MKTRSRLGSCADLERGGSLRRVDARKLKCPRTHQEAEETAVNVRAAVHQTCAKANKISRVALLKQALPTDKGHHPPPFPPCVRPCRIGKC